jgi:hypothetical protein
MILSVARAKLECVECGRQSDPKARGWQGHLVECDDDGEDEVVFFCPLCALREFGDVRRRRRNHRES